MARKETGYAMKSPRGRPHDVIAQVAEPSGKFSWNPQGIEIIILLGDGE